MGCNEACPCANCRGGRRTTNAYLLSADDASDAERADEHDKYDAGNDARDDGVDATANADAHLPRCPCPIFAQAERLGLSEEQKKKLGEIENEARARARAVLTPEQETKLGKVPDKPVTMMETWPMMKMMQGMQEGQKDETPSSPSSTHK